MTIASFENIFSTKSCPTKFVSHPKEFGRTPKQCIKKSRCAKVKYQ